MRPPITPATALLGGAVFCFSPAAASQAAAQQRPASPSAADSAPFTESTPDDADRSVDAANTEPDDADRSVDAANTEPDGADRSVDPANTEPDGADRSAASTEPDDADRSADPATAAAPPGDAGPGDTPDASPAPPPLDATEAWNLSDEEAAKLFEAPVESATANVEAPPREPTRRVLREEQLTTMPGTRGDALRAIEVFPGVGRTPFAANDGPPPLRGSGPSESRVLLDGVPVPLLYHFGGLTSFFNSRLLREVELRPGNHSAYYGRSSAGVVDAHVRDAHPERARATLELSLIDNSALIDAPLGDSSSLALAARRSNIDLVFENMVPDDTFRVTAAPVYYDYQGVFRQDLGGDTRLRVLAYGSHDHLNLVFAHPNDDDPSLAGGLEGELEFHRLQAHLETRTASGFEQTLTLAAGPQDFKQQLGALRGSFQTIDIYGRADWAVPLHATLRARFGVDVENQWLEGNYTGPLPSVEGDARDSDPIATQEQASLTDDLHHLRPGAYAELAYQPTPAVLLIPAVRADYQHEARAVTVDPRVSARVELAESVTAKAASGTFSRPLDYYLLMRELGNPNLDPERVLQNSVGAEYRPHDDVLVDVDGFYKRWLNRVVSTPGGEPPRFDNSGRGRAFGVETLLQLRPLESLSTLVAYTFTHSERLDAEGDWYASEWDQTHNLSVVASYDLGSGFTVGARFRYVTGNPVTPLLGGVYAAEFDQYRPVYGADGSARNPAFHQLDVRLDKRWQLGPVALTAYAEVLNAYNAQNVEGRSYSYDFSKSEDATGLPIFPNLGVRGEL